MQAHKHSGMAGWNESIARRARECKRKAWQQTDHQCHLPSAVVQAIMASDDGSEEVFRAMQAAQSPSWNTQLLMRCLAAKRCLLPCGCTCRSNARQQTGVGPSHPRR
eukprot:scaffold149611_cov18-Tisochrysis_lutea.AAC.1